MDQEGRKPEQKNVNKQNGKPIKTDDEILTRSTKKETTKKGTINKRIPRHMTTGKSPSRTPERTWHTSKQWTGCQFKSPSA
jgi:hypothetical protein